MKWQLLFFSRASSVAYANGARVCCKKSLSAARLAKRELRARSAADLCRTKLEIWSL